MAMDIWENKVCPDKRYGFSLKKNKDKIRYTLRYIPSSAQNVTLVTQSSHSQSTVGNTAAVWLLIITIVIKTAIISSTCIG